MSFLESRAVSARTMQFTIAKTEDRGDTPRLLRNHPMSRLRFRALLFASLTMSAITTSAQPPEPVVPTGFTIEKVAGYPLLHRPIFAGFDETGILYVGESSGENLKRDDMLAKKPHWITRLEDTDDDGVFDKSTKFVDNITLPQGCLWYRGSLYAACPPSIWKFTDTGGDGQADQREEILTGFGFNGNACDTHGPFLSPTGRLYIVQGRHGHEFKDKDGHVYSKGKAGRIYSCRLDGSDVRVHAGGGFDNPVEVDFTEEGECIGTVNILYRDRGDCLMHWVEGGVYPREDQADCVAEFKWTGGLLGPIHNLGHVACSGIMRYRGVHFGDGFKDRWFFTEFNTHKVRYAELKRAGSTFTADVHEFLTCADGDFHPTDVLEDADGSLLVLNTGGWFLNGCPTSRVAKPEIYGGVYRVRKTDGKSVDDPRGRDIDWKTADTNALTAYLLDGRPAVTARAIEENAKRLNEHLLRMARGEEPKGGWVFFKPTDSVYARQTYSLSRAAEFQNREGAVEAIATLLDKPRSDVERGAILSILAARTWSKPIPKSMTRELLDHVTEYNIPNMRLFLELASTRCLDRRTSVLSFDDDSIAKLGALAMRTDFDRYAEHGLIVALQRQRNSGAIIALLHDKSPAVQRVALIALDQMDDSPLTQAMVIPLLLADDATLQQTALEVIARRPGWAAATLSLLKTWVRERELSADRANALRAFLLAQLGDAAVQGFVKEVLEDRETASVVRGLVWEVVQRSTIATWPETWNPLVSAALVSSEEPIALAALRVVTQRSLPGHDAALRAIAADGQRSLTVRCEAVVALGNQPQPLDDAVFVALLSVMLEGTTADHHATIGRALGNGPLSDGQLRRLSGALDAAGPLVLPVLIKAFGRSTDAVVGQALVTALTKSDAATSVSPDELAGVLRKYPDSVRDAAQ
ncbi:MAG: PVC-type heme-binding CxxCH protein, partial [Planctomycetaceae bacterium]|nr:PVC-type heme-binding CxxCH protein [Planctomycetaceae bacterium]